jgi:hypothetical protein
VLDWVIVNEIDLGSWLQTFIPCIIRMTTLANHLIADALKDTVGWREAEQAMQIKEDATQYFAVKQTTT